MANDAAAGFFLRPWRIAMSPLSERREEILALRLDAIRPAARGGIGIGTGKFPTTCSRRMALAHLPTGQRLPRDSVLRNLIGLFAKLSDQLIV